MSTKLPFYLLFAVLVAAAAVVTAESIQSLPADADLARGDGAARGRIGQDAWASTPGPTSRSPRSTARSPACRWAGRRTAEPPRRPWQLRQPRPDQPEAGQPRAAPAARGPHRPRPARSPSFSLPTRQPRQPVQTAPPGAAPAQSQQSRRARPPRRPPPPRPRQRRPPTPAWVSASRPPSRQARPNRRRVAIAVPPSGLVAVVRAPAAARRPRSAHGRARSCVTLMVRRRCRIRGLWMRCRGRRFGLGCRIL